MEWDNVILITVFVCFYVRIDIHIWSIMTLAQTQMTATGGVTWVPNSEAVHKDRSTLGQFSMTETHTHCSCPMDEPFAVQIHGIRRREWNEGQVELLEIYL